MKRRPLDAGVLVFMAALFVTLPCRAETPEEWVQLGTRVHGFFGGFIAAGIRVGLDAKGRLNAGKRGLAVVLYNGDKAPCPCIVDGVMLAAEASPGQGTVQIATQKAPPGFMAVIVVRDRETGLGWRYAIADEWLPKMLEWNKLPPIARYEEAMKAEGLFTMSPDMGH